MNLFQAIKKKLQFLFGDFQETLNGCYISDAYHASGGARRRFDLIITPGEPCLLSFVAFRAASEKCLVREVQDIAQNFTKESKQDLPSIFNEQYSSESGQG